MPRHLDNRVLLIENDEHHRRVLSELLQGHQYDVSVAHAGDEASSALAEGGFDLIVLNAAQMRVVVVRQALNEANSSAPIVALAASDRMPKSPGATRWLAAPFDGSEFLTTVAAAAQAGRTATPSEVEESISRPRMVGRSKPMQKLFETIRRVAPTRATVLITGETGTGKELVARAIHEQSKRAKGAFVPVNCSALPETLMESELFGHVRGSFTGAIADRRGVFEQAHGGTLFLDEISTISPAIQVKLLRVLQERAIQRVGGRGFIPADFRLVAASNADLRQEVEAGRFRQDLYYRLNVFPIEVPPLRERDGDVALLISYFRGRFSAENELDAPSMGPELLTRLNNYPWPGNVRELENFVERSVIMCGTPDCTCIELPAHEEARPERQLLRSAREHQWSLAELEREYILDVLQSNEGQRKRAARMLGIDRRTLYRKLKEYGLNSRFPAELEDLD